jgi:hypothetical protein
MVLPKDIYEVPVTYSSMPETIESLPLCIVSAAASLAWVPTLAELNQ